MNFIKKECCAQNNLYQIISEDLHNKFRQTLLRNNSINLEMEEDRVNNGAFYTGSDGVRYPNITHSFSAKSLKDIIEGCDLMVQSIIEQLPKDHFISFRLPITIEKQEEEYILRTRFATMKRA